jgi:hypothetical protein
MEDGRLMRDIMVFKTEGVDLMATSVIFMPPASC